MYSSSFIINSYPRSVSYQYHTGFFGARLEVGHGERPARARPPCSRRLPPSSRDLVFTQALEETQNPALHIAQDELQTNIVLATVVYERRSRIGTFNVSRNKFEFCTIFSRRYHFSLFDRHHHPASLRLPLFSIFLNPCSAIAALLRLFDAITVPRKPLQAI